MFVKLSQQHSRSISAALLAVMMLSVLQFCMMSMAEGQAMPQGGAHEQPMSHHEMMAEISDTNDSLMNDHDCCFSDADLGHNMAAMETVCPDCEDSESTLQLSSPADLKPLYAFLYVIVQEALDATRQTRTWQAFTEPDILSSLPPIYLAKATFLE